MYTHFYPIIVVIIILIILQYLEIINEPDKYLFKSEKDKYKKFYKEIGGDMDKYGLKESDQEKIETLIKQMIDKKKPEMRDYVKTAKSGLLRGSIISLCMGNNLQTAAFSGSLYAIVNPIIMYGGY